MGGAARVAAAAAAALAAVPGARGAVVPGVVTSGSCKAYPADGFCAVVGLGGRDVFVYDGATHRTDFAVRDQAVQDFFGPLEIAASQLAGYVFVVWLVFGDASWACLWRGRLTRSAQTHMHKLVQTDCVPVLVPRLRC